MSELQTNTPPLIVQQDPVTPVPQKNTLTTSDWEKWTKETLIYNITPLVLVLVQTLQSSYMAHGGLPTGSDLVIAAGCAYGALLAAFINILGKYKSGV